MSEAIIRLADALGSFAQSGVEPAVHSKQIQNLAILCAELFPASVGANWKGEPDCEGAQWALANALRAVAVGREGTALAKAAEAISNGMAATEVTLSHLCPLDLADDLPPLQFGPCEVRQFSRKEFEAQLDWPRLQRHFPSLKLDTGAFANFHWLVVRERMALSDRIGTRAMPFLSIDLGRDFGAITPHLRTWPAVVEQAVFMLLLLPWEDIVTYRDVDWRPFRIPWVYTVNPDPFVQPKWPRGSETLSWEPDIHDDSNTGETIELERPTRMPLKDDCQAPYAVLTDERWNNINSALQSPIFNPLVAHFLVRAFVADEIDEFLSHVIVVEAALGMQRDFQWNARPRIAAASQGATERVARRAASITGEAKAADEYKELFALRNLFVHGRQLGQISSEKRVMARSLARRIANALVGATLTNTFPDRDSFLSALCP